MFHGSHTSHIPVADHGDPFPEAVEDGAGGLARLEELSDEGRCCV